MCLNKYIKIVFTSFIVILSVSCSKKGVFLPANSIYADIRRSDTTHSYYDTTYPIRLTDNLLFEMAYYRDAAELSRSMGFMSAILWRQQVDKIGYYNDKVGYFIVSCDDEYIYNGFLQENNGELYAKYNPIKEDNIDMYPIIRTKNYRKLYYWIVKELNKGATISIIGDKKGIYIGKSFNDV